jgi:phosphopantetheine adenylyltransferase
MPRVTHSIVTLTDKIAIHLIGKHIGRTRIHSIEKRIARIQTHLTERHTNKTRIPWIERPIGRTPIRLIEVLIGKAQGSQTGKLCFIFSSRARSYD